MESREEVSLRNFSKHHIDVDIQEDVANGRWRMIGFYEALDMRSKFEAWNLLKVLGQDQSFPWMVYGNFKEILYSFEKQRGLSRDERQMEEFRSALIACHLEDMRHEGP